MHVVLLVMGSRGDVQPFVGLGVALRGRGHEVTLAAQAPFAPLATEAQLGFRVIPGDPADFFNTPEVIEALRKSPSMLRAGRAMPQPSLDEYADALLQMHRACAGADVVVTSLLTRAAALGDPDTPWCSSSWWPSTRTGDFPAIGAPTLPFGAFYNRFTHSAAASLEWRLSRKLANAYLDRLGRPPLGPDSPYRDLGRTRPFFYPFSPSVVAPPGDWPERCHITGYWFWDRDWQPSAELEAFLADGPPPVAVTFGSTWAVHRQEETVSMAAEACRRAGRRLLMIDGPGEGLPDDALRVHDADYGWLFPRVAAVVHHGGYGTTAAVLQAGVPHVVVPTFADNPFWAARVKSLGVAPDPVPFARLHGDRLTAAVAQAVGDPGLAQRAAQLGAYVRADRGPVRAAEVLEEWTAAHRGAAPASSAT